TSNVEARSPHIGHEVAESDLLGLGVDAPLTPGAVQGTTGEAPRLPGEEVSGDVPFDIAPARRAGAARRRFGFPGAMPAGVDGTSPAAARNSSSASGMAVAMDATPGTVSAQAMSPQLSTPR